jgi:hypothetical protein
MKRILFWVAFIPAALMLLITGYGTMFLLMLVRLSAGLTNCYAQLLDNWEHWCHDTQELQFGRQTMMDAFVDGWGSVNGEQWLV